MGTAGKGGGTMSMLCEKAAQLQMAAQASKQAVRAPFNLIYIITYCLQLDCVSLYPIFVYTFFISCLRSDCLGIFYMDLKPGRSAARRSAPSEARALQRERGRGRGAELRAGPARGPGGKRRALGDGLLGTRRCHTMAPEFECCPPVPNLPPGNSEVSKFTKMFPSPGVRFFSTASRL